MTGRLIVKSVAALIAILAAGVLWLASDMGPQPIKKAGTDVPQAASNKSFSVSSTTIVAVTSTNAVIIRAVDGDTLLARMDGESQEVKVRLLGVNAPESVDPRRPVQCFGKEASHFTAALADGKRVRMEEDPEADERDKYGRLLRFVILEDGMNLNEELVRKGYANAYVSFPMGKRFKSRIRRLQDEARRAGKGLWNSETCGGRK